MTLEKALDIIGIQDLTVETNETVKSKYKKLMIKYHPDNCNGNDSKAKDISSALEVVKEALESIKRYKYLDNTRENYTIMLPVSKLIHLYDGGTVTVGSGENTKVFNKKDIQRYTALIISDVTIVHNGINKTFSSIQHWSISDNYKINCEIVVENLLDKETVLIKLEDFEKEISFQSQAISMKIPLRFNITVEINIVKKLQPTQPKDNN